MYVGIRNVAVKILKSVSDILTGASFCATVFPIPNSDGGGRKRFTTAPASGWRSERAGRPTPGGRFLRGRRAACKRLRGENGIDNPKAILPTLAEAAHQPHTGSL